MSDKTDDYKKSKKKSKKVVYDDKTYDMIIEKMKELKGRKRDIVIKLGLIKPNDGEKEYYNKPSWYNKFKNKLKEVETD